MLEVYPECFDGAVEWEGVFWHPQSRHLMTDVPVFVQAFPIYANFSGDRTKAERNAAYERLLEAGLHPDSEPYWNSYFKYYWIVTLWLYGRNLDPMWEPFQRAWSNDWLQDPSPIANYPWQARLGILKERIEPIANTGIVQKPLLSVAGNWDCLVPFSHHATAYANLVEKEGFAANHRLYEIVAGNHVDGMLRSRQGKQQPVQPYYEAALYALEDWVEQGIEPPKSGVYEQIEEFWPNGSLYSRFV